MKIVERATVVHYHRHCHRIALETACSPSSTRCTGANLHAMVTAGSAWI